MKQFPWMGWVVAGLFTFALQPSAAQSPGCVNCVDSLGGFHMHPGLGLRAGMPQRASVALGAVIGAEWRSGSHPRTPDVAAFIEPGWSAGRATVGITTGYGNMGSGWGLGATILRTWHDSWNMPDNRTFAGVELWAWPVFFIGPRVGVFYPIGRGADSRWRFSGDFGVGL